MTHDRKHKIIRLGLLLALGSASGAAAQPMADMPGMDMNAAPTDPAAPAADHDMDSMAGMPGMAGMPYSGVLGFYPMARDASGTSWQPDSSIHAGLHAERGDWSLMGHALINGVVDRQSGPRGGDKAFVSGMVMGAARRELERGDVINLRVMLSPDPLMGRSGYPLLLAAGETADGRTPLVDRQHPHDLLMELSASYSRRLSITDSVFVYAGLPGSPAFGPPAFMHRMSSMDSPEAPISHHWLDSTHITYGVLTGGYVHDNWKIEASAFKGREPDQRRYDIEQPALDSTAVRLSWNPSADLALQASWARQKSPEALEPERDLRRLSASAIYTRPITDGWWSTTAAWGRRQATGGGRAQDAWLLESAVNRRGWTVFGRAERVASDELGLVHGPVETVAKVSLGVIRDLRLFGPVSVGLGALADRSLAPAALDLRYGGDRTGTMVFARLKVGG